MSGGEGERDKGNWIFNSQENDFPYFSYVVAIISI